jgi:glutamate/tyrosine decarboxylase-like PLP-dependent enzyme
MNDQHILNQTFALIQQYFAKQNDPATKIVDYKSPVELQEQVQFSIDEAGVDENSFLQLMNQYLDYSVHTGNKQFLNQLYAGYNFPAFIGELLTLLSNTSMYTYEVAPMASLIETEMIRLMNSYAGYGNGDGTFVSGGSNTNLLAMFSARNRIDPQARVNGYNSNLRLTAFVSDKAHYSFETAANILGIGSSNLIRVATGNDGRMQAETLETAIQQSIQRGEKPFFIGATCATTLLGSYDPLDDLAEIAQKYDMWLHADGSFGGSVLLSDKHRKLMRGIEKTDSFGWNPHKLMNIPLVCSVFLVKRRGTLQHNLTDLDTDYIYHDIDAVEDLGKKSIQCGRRVDAVKLWFAWKYYGLEGYRKRIDQMMEMAEYAENFVKEHPNLQLLSPVQSFAVCFRYIPSLAVSLNEFNLAVRENMRKSGKSLINYGYIGDQLTIRLVVANGALEKKDIKLFFKHFLQEAIKLEKQQSALQQ